jgi:hypothetical protein
MRSMLGDIGGLLGVALAFPLVILAIGTPVALVIRLLLWSVGLL